MKTEKDKESSGETSKEWVGGATITAAQDYKHKLQILKLEVTLVGKYYNAEELNEKKEMIENLTDQLLEKLEQSE